jgi:2-polyprenyl-6-methoxyphenol hydroxylase-like FAD-dependent oxidoreductase
LRRPAAEQVIEQSHRLTQLATARGPVRRVLRNTVLRLADGLPRARRSIALNLSGLARASLSRIQPCHLQP